MFMESLKADSVQFSSEIDKLLFLEGKMDTRQCLHLVLRFSNVLSSSATREAVHAFTTII